MPQITRTYLTISPKDARAFLEQAGLLGLSDNCHDITINVEIEMLNSRDFVWQLVREAESKGFRLVSSSTDTIV